jgi:pSer/pThr/pTyr-binding forkhead associated (FHA) protein/anti-anti-sigma regulatory factor
VLRIVVERQGAIVRDHIFRQSLVSFGRAAECDVRIDEGWVSAKHLVIRADEKDGVYRLFDQSSNGTFHEGERITTLRFDRETVLTTGDCKITLIPIVRTGTDEVDLFAGTVAEQELPREITEAVAKSDTQPHDKMPRLAELPEAELRAVTQDGELKNFIFRGRALVGRAPECDVRFSALDVSRQHFEIVARESGYVLKRLSRKNPVEVNEAEIGPDAAVMLRDGDVIRMSDEEVVFLCPATHAGRGSTVPGEALPASGLEVSRRGCFNPQVAAFDVVGMLNGETAGEFEEKLGGEVESCRHMLVDLGFLADIDRDGIAAMGRVISKAEESGVGIQFIRVTPKIADLLSYSELKNLLTNHVSRSEETAVRRLLD